MGDDNKLATITFCFYSIFVVINKVIIASLLPSPFFSIGVATKKVTTTAIIVSSVLLHRR